MTLSKAATKPFSNFSHCLNHPNLPFANHPTAQLCMPVPNPQGTRQRPPSPPTLRQGHHGRCWRRHGGQRDAARWRWRTRACMSLRTAASSGCGVVPQSPHRILQGRSMPTCPRGGPPTTPCQHTSTLFRFAKPKAEGCSGDCFAYVGGHLAHGPLQITALYLSFHDAQGRWRREAPKAHKQQGGIRGTFWHVVC